MLDSSTTYTVSGARFTDLDITTNSQRFSDSQISLSSASLNSGGRDPEEKLRIGIDYRLGLGNASKATVKPKDDALVVDQLSIAPRLRAKGVPRMTLGMIYGISLWSQKQSVWGFVDYSRPLEEMLINAGFPSNKIQISEDGDSMFFEATMEQIDYNPDNFYVIRQ